VHNYLQCLNVIISAAAVVCDVFLHILKGMYIKVFDFFLQGFREAVEIFITGKALV